MSLDSPSWSPTPPPRSIPPSTTPRCSTPPTHRIPGAAINTLAGVSHHAIPTDPERANCVSSAEVYQRDVDALLSAHIVIAHVGAPSTGVGAELALAAHGGLAIIAIARTGERVSRFAEGLIDDAGGHLFTFATAHELRSTLQAALTGSDVHATRESKTEPRQRAAS